MPTNRLYSFRFPFDIRSTLEAWRDKLSGPVSGGSFDGVLSQLSDRDRAVEDHLNLGLSQGRLGYMISTSNQAIPDNTEADLTGLTVTVTVPANRVLRITGQVVFAISAPMTLTGWIYEDGVKVAAFGEFADAGAGPGPSMETIQCGSAIRTPGSGAHTYKLTGQSQGSGDGTIGATASAPGFILVEDIGPVNT